MSTSCRSWSDVGDPLGPARRGNIYDIPKNIGEARWEYHPVPRRPCSTRSRGSVRRWATDGDCRSSTYSLKASGLVEARRDGTRQYYRLAGDDVGRLFSLVQTVAEAHLADVAVAAAAVLGSPEDAITREELIRRLDAGEVTLIDVRPHEEYLAGHIPGAISMPLAELVDRLAELPAGHEIVAYCRGAYCVMAPEATRIAKGAGRVVKRLDEGMLEWRLAGLPVEERAS